MSPLQPLLSPSISRFFFIPALGAPTVASALACPNKKLILLGVVVEESRGGVRGFFPVGLRRPQPYHAKSLGRRQMRLMPELRLPLLPQPSLALCFCLAAPGISQSADCPGIYGGGKEYLSPPHPQTSISSISKRSCQSALSSGRPLHSNAPPVAPASPLPPTR